MISAIFSCGALLLPLLFAQSAEAQRPYAKRAVVSVSRPASEVGIRILREGGNAVDAAIATAFALAVTHPQAGNIAGGGFMVVAPPGGQGNFADAKVVDFRETAPAKATASMFQPGDSVRTTKAVGVPGSVAGMELAHKKWGKLPWAQLVEPAVNLARSGFPVEKSLAAALNKVLPETAKSHPEFHRVFSKPAGGAWKTNDELKIPELATTLEAIRDKGAAGFYTGPVADRMVDEMKASGGLISYADLAGYKAELRDPIRVKFRGYEILAAPPPSSGGVCLALILGMLETRQAKQGDRMGVDNLHFLAESMKRAYRERARWLGDPAFAPLPPELLSPGFAARLASTIRMDRATPSASLAGDIPLAPEGDSTTHLSVLDGDGLAVSITTTLEETWGSRIVVAGGGFILNNEMGDFNWVPGRTDKLGRIGTPANQIAPGKRMLSSQCPVVVVREGKVRAVTGSPGGRTIPNTVAQVLWNLLEWDMPARLAVETPRIHHQWLPDQIRMEGATSPARIELTKALLKRGHKVVSSPQGDAHTIWVDAKGQIWAAPDRRIEGAAAGE
jgi:gamma-glutamyltranspeptidase/glutathione hydrolase